MGELKKVRIGLDVDEITPYTAGDNTVIIDPSTKKITVNTNVIPTREDIPAGGGVCMEEITWAALKAKRDAGTLDKGRQYRITDYVCTTTQEESRAVSHPFDVIVFADDESTLNENARACLRDGDDYYSAEGSYAKLEAWELKYRIDNDTDNYPWVDATNGKGVIYWMKDNFNNECPYDFKQIQFARYEITECEAVPSLVGKYTTSQHGDAITAVDEENPVWCYTFSVQSGDMVDSSVTGNSVFENQISAFSHGSNNMLNDIVFIGDDCHSNTFGDHCNYNTFGNYCYYNAFGDDCHSNTFGDGCNSNTLGDHCYSNTFGGYCSYNTFGNGGNYNTFGDGCSSNTFGDDCNSNTFGDYCNYNTFGNYCYYNAFGGYCSYNTFGDHCGFIKFAVGISGQKQYYHILDGVAGTLSTPLAITATANNTYETYVGKNSNGVLKTWVPADLAP